MGNFRLELKMAAYVWFVLLITLAVVASEDVSSEKESSEEVVQNFSGTGENEARETANEMVDRLVDQVNDHIMMSGKDPTELEDNINKFEWKILLIRYSGEISLKNGWMQGLSTLQRYKNAKLTMHGLDKIIETSLQYSTLMFVYEYVAKFMKLGPTGFLDGSMTRSTFTVQIRITPEGRVTLQRFKFNKLGSLSLKWSGNSLTDWMANIFTIVSKPILKPILKYKLSGLVKESIEEIIEEHNSGITY